MVIKIMRNNKTYSYINLFRGVIHMEIKIKLPEDNSHISNLAYIKALLIKSTIENLNISYEEKIKFKNEILEYLANT